MTKAQSDNQVQSFDQVKFGSYVNRPIGEASPAGEAIYEWEYLGADGKTITEKKNVQEQIQSYVRQVDYKTRIKQGEIYDGESNYMDFSELPVDLDPASLSQYLSDLSVKVNELLESSKKAQSAGQSTAKDSEDNNLSTGQTQDDSAGGSK